MGTARPNTCRGSQNSWYSLGAEGKSNVLVFADGLEILEIQSHALLVGYGVYCAYDVTCANSRTFANT